MADIMNEFDFDAPVERRGTGSYKWDTTADGVLPMWVADMDFKTAPIIIDALRRRVDHGVFGYTSVPEGYYEAVDSWFSRRHGYHVARRSIIYVPGVVPAISAIIKALVKPGEGVIVQTPVYNCFFSSIRNNDCITVENPLRRTDCGKGMFTYEIDFDDLETKASVPANRLLLLCNPHNPAGRVWSRDELSRIAEICRRNNVVIVSDEIHCELTMPGFDFVSMATVTDEAIICSSPSKAFNTAGLQIANIIANDPAQRALIDKAVNINEVCDVNPFGITGLIAAYNHGEPWLKALVAYLHDNYRLTRDFFAHHLPELPLARLEATYLVWIDISACHCDGDTLEKLLAKHDGILINSGTMYGDRNYIRLNIATRRALLTDGLHRLAAGLRSLLDRQ